MTCWDSCGYIWREIGESESCTRDVDDGTVVNTRLTAEIIDIRYDYGGIEPFTHEFDAIVKIYELYVGDTFETLVYENVDIFSYSSSKVYYKYVEWDVNFNNINDSPLEVYILVRSKELCPDCTHPYVCDCRDSIPIGWTTWTIAPDAVGNPINEAETMYVELLEIATNLLSININIEIYSNDLLKYTDTRVIGINDYFDISESVLNYDWRINCTDIDPTDATFQLCHSYVDSGEGSGSTGSGLVAAQYFDSTSFGWTCGCVINSVIDNPGGSDEGKNTAPTEVQLDVHVWQGTYSTTKSTIPLVTQTMITPNQEMQGTAYWMPFMWNTELPPGEYMWVITCLRGPHDGSFRLIYIDYGPHQRDQAFVNGYSHRDFYSRIIGVTEDETYQKVISENDTFNTNYICNSGHLRIKAKVSDGSYRGVGTTEKGSNNVGYRSCYTSNGGDNLSFEEPDFTGWQVSEGGNTTIEQSLDTFGTFPMDGITSAKLTVPMFDSGHARLYQYITFTNCATPHSITFDYCIMEHSSSSHHFPPLVLQVYTASILKLKVEVYSDGIWTHTIPNFSGGTLMFEVYGLYGGTPRSIYIDNIRITGGSDYTTSPIGRIAGGSIINV